MGEEVSGCKVVSPHMFGVRPLFVVIAFFQEAIKKEKE